MTLPFRAADEMAQRNFEELERRIEMMDRRIQTLESQPSIHARTAVRGCVGTALNVPNATQTIIVFDGTEDYDSHGFHDSSSNPSRFTIPAGMGGLYQPFLAISLYTAGVGTRQFHRVLINGSGSGAEAAGAQPGYYNPGTSFSFGQMFPPVVLAAGDYLEFTVFQESGSTIVLGAGLHNHGGLILLSQ